MDEVYQKIIEIEDMYKISRCLSNKESIKMFGITHKKFERILKKLKKS